MQEQTKVTQKWIHAQRAEERQTDLKTLIALKTQGAHDQYLPDGLGLGGNCGLCEGQQGVVRQD